MSAELDDERVVALRSDLRSYGAEITQHLTALYSSQRSSSDAFDLKNDPTNMLAMLKHELGQVVSLSQEHSAYLAAHSAEIADCGQLVTTLSTMSAITDNIVSCEHAINTFQFLQASTYIDEIHQALSAVQFSDRELNSGHVFSLLRSESRLLASKLNSKLKRALSECVRFEAGKVSVSRQLRGVLRAEDVVLAEPVALADLLQTAARCGKADEVAADMLHKLWSFVLHPLWLEKKAQTPRVTAAAGEEGQAELLLDSIARDGGQDHSLRSAGGGLLWLLVAEGVVSHVWQRSRLGCGGRIGGCPPRAACRCPRSWTAWASCSASCTQRSSVETQR